MGRAVSVSDLSKPGQAETKLKLQRFHLNLNNLISIILSNRVKFVVFSNPLIFFTSQNERKMSERNFSNIMKNEHGQISLDSFFNKIIFYIFFIYFNLDD